MHRLRSNFVATCLSFLSGVAASGAVNLLAGEKMHSLRWTATISLSAASFLLFLTGVGVLEAARTAVESQTGKHWSSFIGKDDYFFVCTGFALLVGGFAALVWQQLINSC